jgi:Endoglucanase Y
MLIAYGLLLAGGAWDEPAYAEAAAPMIRTIGRTLLVTADGLPVILPGRKASPAPRRTPGRCSTPPTGSTRCFPPSRGSIR